MAEKFNVDIETATQVTSDYGEDQIQVLEGLDLFVCITDEMTETALLADYVLPAASFLESPSLPVFTSGQAATVAIASPVTSNDEGTARPVAEIITDLADACGLRDAFAFSVDEAAAKLRLTSGGNPLAAAELREQIKAKETELEHALSEADLNGARRARAEKEELEEKVEKLADTIIRAKSTIRYCSQCLTLTDKELCPICSNPSRDQKTIMVVENPRDMSAYEKTRKYNGVYHVLHGAISPMLGIGPADIRLKELMHRLEQDVDEVIIATNSSLEGETTAMYISKLVKPTGIKVSRIASGVPVGGDLEYIDEVTLLRALEGRVEL